MFKSIAALLLAAGVFVSVLWAQTPSNPTQQSIAASRDEGPVFRITVVGRTTPAINYRPRRGDTKIDFNGTALMPQANGTATVSGEKGYIRIEARFEDLGPAERFGREYLTYVLWAITPEGRATNLGELQVDDGDARAKVTTQLQAFGLIVTAEPYFAVTQPSDVVVMENAVRKGRDGTEGSVEVVEAKYELLKRGSYLMNQDAARLNIEAPEPGSSLDLAQARNAVNLARLAGADRFAAETFDKAAQLLATAEEAKRRRRGGNAVMMPARQASQTAEDARLVALTRQEEAYEAEQRGLALTRERGALDRAQAEGVRRRDAELAAQAASAARVTAERDATAAAAAKVDAEVTTQAATQARLVAERDAATATQARAAAELDAQSASQARVAAERDTQVARSAAAEAEAGRLAAEAALAKAEAGRATAESARAAADAEARLAQEVIAKGEQEKTALRGQLREQLNVVLDTRETTRGLVVNLSDVLFDTGSANLKDGARVKLARVSGILVSHPGLQLALEGHTDSVGTDAHNLVLSERRAESVKVFMVQQRIPTASVGTAGLGEGQPVATNDTASGRQQNRRVELVVSGEEIGVR